MKPTIAFLVRIACAAWLLYQIYYGSRVCLVGMLALQFIFNESAGLLLTETADAVLRIGK